MFPVYRPEEIRSAVAEETLAAYRVLTNGATAGTVKHATAASDNLLGITLDTNGSDPSDMVLADDDVDYAVKGDIPAEYGDTVTAGQFLTSDSIGRVVPCDADGENIIAKALVDGIVGDVKGVEMVQGTYQS